jgi:hypothetical protein
MSPERLSRALGVWTWAWLVVGLVLLGLQSQRAERTPDERNYQLAGRVLLERRGLHTVEQRFQGPLILLGTQLTDDRERSVSDDGALRRARLGMLVFPALLLLVLVAWTRQALGERAAAAVACLAATHPSLLAYGPLLSSDVAFTATGLAAAYAAHRWLLQPGVWRAVVFALLLGAHGATKYTSAITGAGILLVVLVAALRGFDPWPRRIGAARGIAGRLLVTIGALAGICLLALAVLYAAYLFASPSSPAAAIAGLQSGALRAVAALPLGSALLGLLPEPLLLGLDYQAVVTGATTNGTFAGMRGNHAAYYPVTLLAKTPLPELLLVAVGGLAALRACAGASFWALLFAPGLLLLAYCSGTRALQMGVRYVLPLVPALLGLAGAAFASPWLAGRRGLAVGALVLVASLANVVQHWQQPLGHFNLLFGGSTGGYRWCADGNCDWDQRYTTGAAAVRQRHPDVEVLHQGQGPRFGKVAIYSEDLLAVDPRDASRCYHWLDRFAPIDHDGAAWLVYDVEAADFERAITAGDRRAAEDLAIAWLLRGDATAAAAALQRLGPGDDPAVASTRALVAAIAAAGDDRARNDAAAELATRAGHFELALARLDRTNRQNAVREFWLLTQLGRVPEAIDVLERKTADGSRTDEEVVLLVLSLVDGGKRYPPDPERAQALLQAAAEPKADSPWHAAWVPMRQRVAAAVARERRLDPFK